MREQAPMTAGRARSRAAVSRCELLLVLDHQRHGVDAESIVQRLNPIPGQRSLAYDAGEALRVIAELVASGDIEPLSLPIVEAVIDDGLDLVAELAAVGSLTGLIHRLIALRADRQPPKPGLPA